MSNYFGRTLGGLGTEFDLGLLFDSSPIVALFLVLGFALMFLGPLYYWIIEPILNRNITPS